MYNCSILFSSDNGNGYSTHQIQGKLNRIGGLNKISFSIEKDGSLSYVFSVLESKVMLATKGDFCYSFCLEKGKTFNFLIEAMKKQFNASVYCKDLVVSVTEKQIEVCAKYSLDFSGNKSENKIKLKVNL